jgi:hypothetical protein
MPASFLFGWFLLFCYAFDCVDHYCSSVDTCNCGHAILMLISKFPVSGESSLCQWLPFHFYTVNMFTACYAFMLQYVHMAYSFDFMFILCRTYGAITVN